MVVRGLVHLTQPANLTAKEPHPPVSSPVSLLMNLRRQRLKKLSARLLPTDMYVAVR